MRIRYSLRSLLLFIAALSCVAVIPQMVARHDVQTRRLHSLESFNWRGGSEADRARYDALSAAERAWRDALCTAVAESTFASLRKPKLTSAFVAAQSELGYVIVADWISRAPVSDGVRIAFSDNTTVDIKIDKMNVKENQRLQKEGVWFRSVVRRNDLPQSKSNTTAADVASIALMSGNKIWSNTVSVGHL